MISQPSTLSLTTSSFSIVILHITVALTFGSTQQPMFPP